MLETLREYAADQLKASGELDRIRAAHAAYYSRLAEPVAAARITAPWVGPQSSALTDEAIHRLEAEYDNLHSALEWWCTSRQPAEGLRLALALNSLWSRLGQYAVGRGWLEAMLDLADATAQAAALRAERAVALTDAGTHAGRQGDNEKARTFHRRSVELWRELQYAPGVAVALANLGLAEWVEGDPEQATRLLEEALPLSRAANLPHTVAIVLRSLGLIARAQGQYARAEVLFADAMAQPLPAGWFRDYSLARSISCLGRVAFLQNEPSRARALLGQALDVIRQARVTGQALADCLDWQAALEFQDGDSVRAVRLFGAADSHWRSSGAHRYAPEEGAHAHDVAAVRAAVDHQTFAGAWSEGAAMSVQQAIAYALESEAAPALAR
jgi:tetratricopeptide (TPR) repeat protein